MTQTKFVEPQTADRLWLQGGIVLIAVMVASYFASMVDTRTFNGINPWIKPMKFQFSVAIHFFTFFLVARLMPVADRQKPVFVSIVWMTVIAAIFEIGLITLRGAQARASHFNQDTPLDLLLYALMGIGSLVLVLPCFYIGARFLRSGDQFRGGPGLKAGIGWGFIVGALLTIVFGGYMSQQGSHWTSGQLTDADGLPLTGWSAIGGDLRVAHFFATHLMQALPVLGWMADKVLGSTGRLSVAPVWLGLVAGAGISAFTFWQALAGQAFLS